MMAVQTSDDMQARELMVDVATFTDAESRQAFYARIGERSMTPLWENLHALVLAQPATPAQPHLWQYDDMARPFLMEAGQLWRIPASRDRRLSHVHYMQGCNWCCPAT